MYLRRPRGVRAEDRWALLQQAALTRTPNTIVTRLFVLLERRCESSEISMGAGLPVGDGSAELPVDCLFPRSPTAPCLRRCYARIQLVAQLM